jgi:hypothetical protein
MKLPRAEEAYVDPRKLLDYLLDVQHPTGASKARFFLGLGFRRSDWGSLAAQLRSVARDGEVVDVIPAPHGMKYVVVGSIAIGSGRFVNVKSIWIIRTGEDVPRLVTAYPE